VLKLIPGFQLDQPGLDDLHKVAGRFPPASGRESSASIAAVDGGDLQVGPWLVGLGLGDRQIALEQAQRVPAVMSRTRCGSSLLYSLRSGAVGRVSGAMVRPP
jgi:hypothetical protein